jgi:hypothetical protein
MTLYANPNFFKVVIVSYSMASNVFSCGNTLHFSKPNNSFTNAFMVQCVYNSSLLIVLLLNLTKLTFDKMGFSQVY